jgi:NADPH:quinone reductase-like Zn-dependent oxidoreductase
MKAIEINTFGGTDVLKLVDIPEPSPTSGEVLVKIHAASVNPADSKVRQGTGPGAGNVTFPYIIGRDFSGIITALGENVTDFNPGDPVFGVLPMGREGTYLEALCIDTSLIALKPESLSHSEAAAIALSGLTSLVALEDTLELQAEERILIHGGAGGVGSYAVQLAHHLGAEVITTASPKNHEYLQDLGANQVIDYNSEDFTEVLTDIDAVFDLIGGEVHQRSFKVLKPGGRLAYIAPLLKDALPPRDDIEVLRPNVQRDQAHLLRIIDLHEAGAIIPPDIQSFPLSDAGKAHDLIDTHHVRGKIVLQID